MITSRPMTSVCLALALATTMVTATAADNKAKPPARPADKPVAAPTEKGRDWSLIDTNKDGYISPEEMEVWLKANPGPQK